MFALREACSYLEWQLNIDPRRLESFRSHGLPGLQKPWTLPPELLPPGSHNQAIRSPQADNQLDWRRHPHGPVALVNNTIFITCDTTRTLAPARTVYAVKAEVTQYGIAKTLYFTYYFPLSVRKLILCRV
jgi:hypothetical protein